MNQSPAKSLRFEDPRARLRTGIYVALMSVFISAAVFGICAGQYSISPGTVLQIIMDSVGSADHTPPQLDERIVMLVRAPRIMLASVCGMGLALAGAAMQGVFRNPIAAPELLGVSSGAAFGGVLAILLGVPSPLLIANAFLGGFLALLLVAMIARLGVRSDTTTVILAGIVVAAFFSALVSVVQLFADPQNSLPAIVFWLMGSFAAASWQQVMIVFPPVLLACVMIWLMRFRLNVLSLGEEEASTLGIDVDRNRWLIFLSVALVSGTTVAVAGIVGWVGLVVPHLARVLVGDDHRHLLPASALLGASYLCLMDTLARSATTVEIPLGVLTAIIGAPFVAILLRRLRNSSEMHR
ncbi:MAG: FecCD family ABC transporter permease [Parvibaculaceae bacterium]